MMTTPADVLDDTKNDGEDDAEFSDNPLIIDEDLETECDPTLVQDCFVSCPLVNQTDTSFSSKEDGSRANDVSGVKDNISSCLYLIDHNYFLSTVKDIDKANTVNNSSVNYQNENVVVSQGFLSENSELQQSMQKKSFQEGPQSKGLKQFDLKYATTVTVNRFEGDESKKCIGTCFTQKGDTQVRSCKKNFDEKKDFEIYVQGQTLQSKSEHKGNSALRTKSSDKVEDNVISMNDSNTKKSISLSSSLQKKALRPIRPKTGEKVKILLSLIPAFNTKQGFKIAKTEQTIKESVHETGTEHCVKAKTSLLNKRKITVTKRICSETTLQMPQTGKEAVKVSNSDNKLTEKSSTAQYSVQNSDKILFLSKRGEVLLKNQAVNSYHDETGTCLSSKSGGIANNTSIFHGEETTFNADFLGLSESHKDGNSEITVLKEDAVKTLVHSKTECDAESVAFQGEFDKYISEINDSLKVMSEMNQFIHPNCGVKNSETQLDDPFKTDVEDIKPDVDELTKSCCPMDNTAKSFEPDSEELKVLECKECCSVFDNVTSFDLHLIWCNVEAKKTKICDVCRVAFSDLRSMNTHQCSRVKDSLAYTCGVCKKVFKKRDVVFSHMKIHNTKKEFVCEICQKSFLHKHHLVNHMNSHGSDRPYKCQICSAKFKRISHLQKHQTSHKPTTDKTFKCQICDWSFHTKYGLTRHELTHAPSRKTFICSICKGSFREQNILARHMKTVHSGAKKSCKKTKRQIECKICGAGFFWKKHLKIHMASHGNILSDSDDDTDD